MAIIITVESEDNQTRKITISCTNVAKIVKFEGHNGAAVQTKWTYLTNEMPKSSCTPSKKDQ
jgi:hypothetical protein